MDIVFFGAGVSREFGVPTTREMVFEFRDLLKPITSDDYIDKGLCDWIFSRLREYPDFDIETLITVLEHIIDPSKTIQHVLAHPALRYFPVMGASWNMITSIIVDESNREKESAKRILSKVKDFVISKCGIILLHSDERLSILDRFFTSVFGGSTDFAVLRQTDYPINIALDLFSTNYDRIVETYCIYCKWLMNNGEGEVREGAFSARAGELDLLKLTSISKGCKVYKLHGTINWYVDDGTGKAMFSPAVPEVGKRDLYGSQVRENMLIFPIRDWYTFREPYYPLFHALKAKLLDCKHCYVVGYSFRDEDILGLFMDATDLNKRLTFCIVDPAAQEIAETKLAKYQERLSLIPYQLSDARTPDMIQDYRRRR